jgi:Alr-MurF fusion protein
VYLIKNICEIVSGSFIQFSKNDKVSELSYDSRKIQSPEKTLFFALRTAHADGHQFLEDAYQKGVRNFCVAQETDAAKFPGSNIILVGNTLKALQSLAAYHRSQFALPVIGITGSNGKTIVKEWLYQLLHEDYNIVRSPRSYNSQLGVPLSVWQINHQHTLGIFEAGISEVGEMQNLEEIIKPDIGVLTNIGEAHDAGFNSSEQKKQEKLKLFTYSDVVIGPYQWLSDHPKEAFAWGAATEAKLQVLTIERSLSNPQHTVAFAKMKDQKFVLNIPFADEASVQNALTCVCVLLYLNYDIETINQRLPRLHAIDMRLHFMHGINDCAIINDSYSADLTSFHIALAFLKQQNTGQRRKVILSDFFESGKTDDELYEAIADDLKQNKVAGVIAIGERISSFLPKYLPDAIVVQTYPDTESFIKHFRSSGFNNETILIKGARKFEFERIAQLFEQKVHQTLLEINLNAIVHNLKQYRRLLHKNTRIMAMVKAFAYGSGGAEIASILQFNNVSHLGVAYVDEGVELRKSGITLPIMVMNADVSSFNAIVDYSLEPVIYSFSLLDQFNHYINDQALPSYPVHIEIETGMNRLGFSVGEAGRLGEVLSGSVLKIVSAFSHLAASEDAAQDNFTMEQANRFEQALTILKKHISYPFIKHISNSAAIVRHPQLQMDMVRLGIGLYGVEIETHTLQLQPVATLRSTIAQIKQLKAGETVSYNRRGVMKEDSVIATVRIGYADGYSRRFGNGIGKMCVKGKSVPVVGTVCMDMTMIDITGLSNVQEGDEVVIFGKELPVQKMASWIDTIPYEIMTSVSQRVKRVYFQE